MRQATLERLLELNRGFYQSFAVPFSETRDRPQPGVMRALHSVAPQAAVLDLGCGNGAVAAELARRGHAGAYVGLDSSATLLELARGRVDRPGWRFVLAELADEGWPAQASEALRAPRRTFQHALAFAVLHHLPGESLRSRLLRQIHGLLAPGGRFTLSVWNFLASPRLRKRIRPWGDAGLAEAELDPGDYLMDWRRGGRGLRYVHHFTEPELAALAEAGGFRLVESYLSDGEGCALGRYQIWERTAP